jgi:SAM-dependent methyltransferase
MNMVIDEAANRKTYTDERVIRSYARWTECFPAEESIFKRHSTQFAGDVLDIAIGAGRTTRVLLPQARSYVGLDYSVGMIAAAKANFPQADLRCGDMRAVPQSFRDRRFDAVLISYNGIDYIPWPDRHKLLVELRRLLRSEGVLVFSSHDLAMLDAERGFKIRSDLHLEGQLFRKQPAEYFARLLKLPIWLLSAWRKHRRLRSSERIFAGYAYVNDSGENFGLLTTYVSTALQVQVLRDAGYADIQIEQPWLNSSPASFNYFHATAR